jgi:hypothetical protein
MTIFYIIIINAVTESNGQPTLDKHQHPIIPHPRHHPSNPDSKRVCTDVVCTAIGLTFTAALLITSLFIFNQGTPAPIKIISQNQPSPQTQRDGSVATTSPATRIYTSPTFLASQFPSNAGSKTMCQRLPHPKPNRPRLRPHPRHRLQIQLQPTILRRLLPQHRRIK